MHNFLRFLVSLLGTVYSQPSIIMIAPCKKSIILISIVRSTLKQRGTGGKVRGWTRWKARAPLSAQMATHPRSPLLPPLHHTRQQPTHQMLGQCLTASGASLWRAASPSASSDLVSSHLISSNLIWSSLISSDIWSGRMPPDAHSSCDQTIWWPPLVKEAPAPYPQISTSNSVFRNIFGRCSEMFSQIFSTSISRHSFSFLTVTDATIHGRCAQSESDSFFWLLSPGRACYGTVLAVPYVQNIFQPKILKMFFGGLNVDIGDTLERAYLWGLRCLGRCGSIQCTHTEQIIQTLFWLRVFQTMDMPYVLYWGHCASVSFCVFFVIVRHSLPRPSSPKTCITP